MLKKGYKEVIVMLKLTILVLMFPLLSAERDRALKCLGTSSFKNVIALSFDWICSV